MADTAHRSPDVHPSVAPLTAYDDAPPAALLEFMRKGWAPPSSGLPAPLDGLEYFAARRAALSVLFPGETLVVPTGHERVRANDTTYRFRPGTDYYYLTGSLEPDCVLVMTPNDGDHDSTLFVEPNPGKSDATFYTDRAKGELWVGPRLGVSEAAARFGVSARPLSDLADVIRILNREDAPRPYRLLRGLDVHVDAILPETRERDMTFAAALAEMRLIKDRAEVEQLEAAIAATQRGFEDVVRALPRSPTERWVEGVFNLRARVEGNDVGYSTIAASGAHACTLHWTTNDGDVRPGDLLLLDAGVEAYTLYTADITRTIPVSGRFSGVQRDIYTLVFEAQSAALDACRPGNDFLAPNRAAMQVLAHGLERLGILPMSAAEALLDTNQFYKRYSLHNVSHMLGLDVHDCAAARKETYKYGRLSAGMVLTVEPGLYFQLDDLTVPQRYRGIGVRIEDDILITPQGYRILSAGLPRDPDAVETWMSGLLASPEHR